MMNLLYNSLYLQHDTGMHPESARRLEMFADLPEAPLHDGREYLTLVHSESYVDKVEKACRLRAHLDPDTVTSPGSFKAATHAVGATIRAAEQGAFALVRPPGHHAYPQKSSGFCLFNNVAIAAQWLAEQGQRVLIFDFDGHLGDGTSAIFYDSDQVMYWSVHQYPAFPGHGFVDEIGKGKGEGYTLNVPLPPGSGDDIFLDAVENYLPLAEQFAPDVVAVSAGFDAHQHDLLLNLRVTVDTFYRLGQLLRDHFPRLFATLEGGYNVEYLRQGVYNFVAGVNGLPKPYSETSTQSTIQVWQTYEINLHSGLARLKPWWKM